MYEDADQAWHPHGLINAVIFLCLDILNFFKQLPVWSKMGVFWKRGSFYNVCPFKFEHDKKKNIFVCFYIV